MIKTLAGRWIPDSSAVHWIDLKKHSLQGCVCLTPELGNPNSWFLTLAVISLELQQRLLPQNLDNGSHTLWRRDVLTGRIPRLNTAPQILQRLFSSHARYGLTAGHHFTSLSGRVPGESPMWRELLAVTEPSGKNTLMHGRGEDRVRLYDLLRIKSERQCLCKVQSSTLAEAAAIGIPGSPCTNLIGDVQTCLKFNA